MNSALSCRSRRACARPRVMARSSAVDARVAEVIGTDTRAHTGVVDQRCEGHAGAARADVRHAQLSTGLARGRPNRVIRNHDVRG